MMKFFSFKTEKPRQFEYKPRHYDERQETLDPLRREMGLSGEQGHSDKMRARMQHEWRRRKDAQRRHRSNVMKLTILVGLAVLVLWFMLR
ncbi:MAG: hypothetical protein FWF09_05920 [Bacteroidales bacterium]|jgi:hypothetical protein|nr:hypothetical protein [Bacteroidales bacterium]